MSFIKKTIKYSVWLIGAICILVIALYIFIQTEAFNKIALSFALDKLNNSDSWVKKDNLIYAESINGNLLKGLKINNIVVTVKKDTLVSLNYLYLKYDIWGLFNKTINVDSVVLNSPVINLSKIKDGSDSLAWNFSNLFSPSTDTSAAADFNWKIYVNSLRIENGKFRILDTIPSKPLWALEWEKQNEFSFNKLNISDFELDISGEYSKSIKKLNLRNLSFNSNTDFHLKNLAFDAYINSADTTTDVSNFVLITDRSDVRISRLSAYSFNPLDSNAFVNYMNTKMSFTLNTDRFNFADLKFFLPTVDMLDSSVSLYINANGILNNLNIASLDLNLPNSFLNIKGNIKNLNNTDSMYLDVTTSGRINSEDVKTVLNINSIPDFKRLGIVILDVTYTGNIFDFYSNFDIRTSGGDIQGHGNLNIQEERYDGNITANNLNLASVLNDNKYKSNINITAAFNGSGYTPNKMSTSVKYKLGNSNALGYSISNSSGTVSINRNVIGVNINANSTSGNAVVAGKINVSNSKNPVYSFKGKMNNVDISRLSGNIKDKSSLNASFDVNGSGVNMKDIAGKFNVDFGDSYYSDYNIPKTTARINLSSDTSSVLLTNTAMEMRAQGKFSFYSLIDAILYNVSLVSNITERMSNPDSNIVITDLPDNKRKEDININYSLITKDSSELKKLTFPFGFVFNGDVNGILSNSVEGFSTKSVISVKDFAYKDTTLILKNIKSSFSFKNVYSIRDNTNPVSSMNLNLDVDADKLKFGSFVLDSVKSEITLSESVANISAKGKIDSLKYARFKSSSNLRGDDIVFNVDSLYAKYNDYSVVNNNNWIIHYAPAKEIKIEQLGLKTGNMALKVDGLYSFNGSSNINVTGDNINLGQIYEMLRPYDTTLTGEKNVYPVQGEFKRLFVHLEGTPDDANISLEVKTNTLKYDSLGIGTIAGNVIYKDQILSPDIIITNNGEKGSLKLKGNVPFDNPLIQKDTSSIPVDRPAELHLIADKFEIQYFTKLIPGIGELQGVLNGNIDAAGSYLNPDLKGKLTMLKGKYLLDLTGMYYDFKFNVSTENSKLIIDNISLYNPADDTKHIDLRGSIDFKGYKLNDIDLTTSGDMVLLDKSNKENKLSLKGYVLGGIGTPPITIKGNLDKLNIKGQFLIKNATIASLPDSRRGYQKSEKNIIYINDRDSVFVSDTNRRKVTLGEYERINPFLRNRFILVDTAKNISIMDMLALDLAIKTEKNMNISIDFKNLTRDRLFGEVNADLRLRSNRGRLLATGEVNVVGNSYYRFYRDFKVKESKIVFNGPIDKPQLDIRAVYLNTKSTEQFGTITNNPIQVVLTVVGEPSNPEIALKLYENGTEMQGNDATSDAITFLLFGKYKNELSASESQSVATGIGSTVGSLYVTSFFGQVLRDLVPFIKDAELNYTEGGLQNTNVNVSSDIYGANVTVGSRIVNNNSYLEFNVEYPINDIAKLKLPEKVLLQFAREQVNSSLVSNINLYYSTGLKVVYKFKF